MNTEPTKMSSVKASRQDVSTPKVSIGMPVYNGEPFIREALDSLLAQTFTDFELIISDNASTDGTEAICREYTKKDGRVRYMRQPENQGPVVNFQFVLDEAKGEYFMWAAADDRRHPEFVSMAVQVLLASPQCGLVFSAMETKDLVSGNSTCSLTGFTTLSSKPMRALFRIAQPCPSLIYGLFRKEVLLKLNVQRYDFFDVYLGLWFELNSGICVIPLALYVAGVSGVRMPYSITDKRINPKAYFRETARLLHSHLDFLPASILSSVNRYLIGRTTKVLNQLIASDAK
jgi:glycosyltransferase involved in cell wall biosynthesis